MSRFYGLKLLSVQAWTFPTYTQFKVRDISYALNLSTIMILKCLKEPQQNNFILLAELELQMTYKLDIIAHRFSFLPIQHTKCPSVVFRGLHYN